MSELVFGTAEEIYQLTLMICLDGKPEYADAAAIFGETIVNRGSLCIAAWNLHDQSAIETIAISGYRGTSEGKLIVPGFNEIKNVLRKLGIPRDDIISYPLSATSLTDRPIPPSTDAEAIGLVKFAAERGWESMFLIAPPLHILRVFVSVVSVIIKTNSPLRVWAYPCDIRGWNKTIVHSQTAPEAPRWDIIVGELEKIERYHIGGDHVSARELIEYMKSRYR